MIQLPTLRGAFQHRGNYAVPLHAHPHHELILVRSGRLRTALGGHDQLGRRGILHVVPANCRHDQRNRGTWATTCVHVDHLAAVIPSALATVDLAEDPLAVRLVDDLVDLHRRGADQVESGGLLLTLLHRIARSGAGSGSAVVLPEAVARACAFIDDHLVKPLTDEAVAEAGNLSVSHLGALFRRHLGCGPLRWQQQRRLELAARLLADPYAPVATVATRCGYADTTHFIRHFRRQHGATPGRWRRGRIGAAP